VVENRAFSNPLVHNNRWENGCEYFRDVFFTTGSATMWCKNIAEKFNPVNRNTKLQTDDRRNCDANSPTWCSNVRRKT